MGDIDLRTPVIEREGSLTFAHTAQGDIELQEVCGGSSIPARYPPMSGTTVDWSLIHRSDNTQAPGTEAGGKGGAHRSSVGLEGDPTDKEALEAGGDPRIRLRKGRYTKQRSKHREDSPSSEDPQGDMCLRIRHRRQNLRGRVYSGGEQLIRKRSQGSSRKQERRHGHEEEED